MAWVVSPSQPLEVFVPSLFLTHTNSYGSHFTFQSDFSSFSSSLKELQCLSLGNIFYILSVYLSSYWLWVIHLDIHCLLQLHTLLQQCFIFLILIMTSQRLTHALVDFEGIDGALRNNLISHQFDLLSNSRVTRYFCLDLSLLEYLDIAKDWRVYCTKQCCPQCRDQPNDLMCPASF